MYFRFAFALGAIFCVLSAAGMRPPAPAIAVGGQPARFLSQYDWTLDANWFGGFSGIEVTEDGKSFSTITDQSHFVRGAFIRNGDKIIGVNIDELKLVK